MTNEDPLRDEQPQARIGPYRILEALGEGGMGSVYFAEQREPVRRRFVIKLGMISKKYLDGTREGSRSSAGSAAPDGLRSSPHTRP